MMKTLGKRIQQLRKQKGMSQQDLSDVLNITRQTISKWESDQTLPDLNTLIKMAELFNVSIAYIVGVEEDNKSISEVYDLMQTVLSNQQKSNKHRSIIQIATIVLCVVSLLLNLVMTYQLNQKTTGVESFLLTPLGEYNNTITAMYNDNVDSFERIENNIYIDSSSYLFPKYFNIRQGVVGLEGEFNLLEHTTETSVFLTFQTAQDEFEYPLEYDKDNTFVFNQTIPLEDYTGVIMTIKEPDKTKTFDLTNQVPNQFLTFVIYKHLNLFIPVSEKGKTQLDTLVFDATYYNHNDDSRFWGFLDGEITVSIYKDNQYQPLETFTVAFDETATIELNQKLPTNTPLFITVEYSVAKPTGGNVTSHVGLGSIHTGDKAFLNFTIDNTDKQCKILQLPISKEAEVYLFND